MNPCGCHWDPKDGIVYCAIHKAAPELLRALERIAHGEMGHDDVDADLNQAYHAQGIALAALPQKESPA